VIIATIAQGKWRGFGCEGRSRGSFWKAHEGINATSLPQQRNPVVEKAQSGNPVAVFRGVIFCYVPDSEASRGQRSNPLRYTGED